MSPDEWRAWAESLPHPIVLDGGLASTLESQGYSLEGSLWSSGLLMDRPEAISRVTSAFLNAGADIVSTATYQADQAAFAARFVCQDDAAALMRSGISIAQEARRTAQQRKPRPLVALSLGPHAATLGGGAEYHASPDLAPDAEHFHRRRAHLFLSSEGPSSAERTNGYPDLVAYETIPSVSEAVFIVEMMRSEQGIFVPPFWVSFLCPGDGQTLSSGELLAEAVRKTLVANAADPALVAVGVNCCEPKVIPSLVQVVRQELDEYASRRNGNVPQVRIVVYPNSGEQWTEGSGGQWIWPQGMSQTAEHWAEAVASSGADIVGGCCRCGPRHVSTFQ